MYTALEMKFLPAVFAIAALSVQAEIRIGIIGTDTSHVPAFTKMLNDASGKDYIPGARVVAAYKGGSKDLKESYERVDKFADEIRTKYGVELVPDIATLCSKVDAVLIESVDGRPHLEQARQVIAAKKPFFIDKPLAATLEDAREIARLAKDAGIPWFTSSSLRWNEVTANMSGRDAQAVTVWGPGPEHPTHQLDMSWYGIHAVEMLYAMMGTGCQEVTRTTGKDSDVVAGRWKDGRIGTVITLRPYGPFGAMVVKNQKVATSPPDFKTGYQQLVREIVKFLETKQSPVPEAETLEIFAFMDAAQRSKQSGGKAVTLR